MLVAAKLQKELEKAIFDALMAEFSKEGSADPTTHKRMAKAISSIADVIVKTLQTDAQVAPGIPTAGGPAAQVTTAPGKII